MFGAQALEDGGAIGAVDEFNRAIEMLDQGSATLHPVATIEIVHPIDLCDLRAMDVPTDESIDLVMVRCFSNRLFKV